MGGGSEAARVAQEPAGATAGEKEPCSEREEGRQERAAQQKVESKRGYKERAQTETASAIGRDVVQQIQQIEVFHQLVEAVNSSSYSISISSRELHVPKRRFVLGTRLIWGTGGG